MRLSVSRVVALALAATPALTAEALAAAPCYKMVLDAATPEHGVKTISLVKNPAIQRGWVALSAVSETAKLVHLSTATEGVAKQVITGPALLPGQKILRLDAEGNPFYITFDAPTIEAVMYQFAAQGLHASTNQDHSIALQGNTVVESWIVRDPARDPATVLGIADVPAGTWMMSVRIPDEQYWLSEIVTGNKTGFSIEGLFDSEQLNLAAVAAAPTPVKKNWVTALLAMLPSLGKEKAAEVQLALGLEQLADGRSVSIDDTTGAVTLIGADGQPGEPLPDGEYDLQNGGKLVVAGGVRNDGEGPAAVDGAAAAGAAADGQPTNPPAGEASVEQRVGKLETAVNEILGIVKTLQPAESPATAPAAQKMAAQLHGVQLAALGDKLTELKLDAIELAEGDKLTYNAVTGKLTDSKGALVESGYYAAADNSYFQVSTSQYIWEIDKQTYDMVYGAKLQAVELADLKEKVAKTPAGRAVKLSGDETTAETAAPTTIKGRAALRLAYAEATR